MRIAVGSDVVFIPRVQSLVDSNGLQRVLRPSEIKRSALDHIAGRIALKEAAIKALGLSVDDWLRIVISQPHNKPVVELLDMPEDIESIDCSISHDGDYAFAAVVVLYR